MKTLYLNNAATSYPKPPHVKEALDRFLLSPPVTPGRAGFSAKGGDMVSQCRKRLARFLNARNPDDVCFTSGATESLNLAILGLNLDGGKVVTTTLEHNSVIRPLKQLEKEGRISLTFVPATSNGTLDNEALLSAVDETTRLVVLNHASNVVPSVTDIDSLVPAIRQKGVRVLIDASQSAGILPLDIGRLRPDLVALTGHKGLFGLPGIGALYIAPDLALKPLKTGGTGIRSNLLYQPEERPLHYEAGTPNLPGIAALDAGLRFIEEEGRERLFARKQAIFVRLRDILRELPGVILYGNGLSETGNAVLSFNFQGQDPDDVRYIL
ncbi:MAG: hypothetical protein A2293_04640, partial [Elusimicrobia bacterium RIFOXYB2_FULL_49_7]